TQVEPVAVGNLVMNISGDQGGTLRSKVGQDTHQLRISNVVRRCRLAYFPTAIQDVKGCRAGGKVDVIALEVVSLVSKNIKELEGMWDGGQRLVDDGFCEIGVTGFFVDASAMVGQHAEHDFVMNLNPQLAHHLPGFSNDFLDQFVP